MPRVWTENSLLAKIARAFPSTGGGKISRANSASANHLSLGIGDDAALFQPTRGCETILTCDWFLEGTHFLRASHPADAVGWKCLARAVSDIAAMGGTPRCFLMSLALPESATGIWLGEFLRGLRRAANRFDCALAGGDTTKLDDILINVTVVGEVPTGRALRRDGAHAGDLLYVSGRLGEAERGLRDLRRTAIRRTADGPIVNRNDAPLRKHLYPEPRLALGQWLVAKHLATAAMDLSDGLSSDLPRLCAASGVGARIDAGKIPLVNLLASPHRARHKAKRSQHDEALELGLHGGDDYELLFTVPRSKASRVPTFFKAISLLPIGEITPSRKILLIGDGRKPAVLKPGGWDPFR
jgi:thiamine-monophosphate kinase